MQTRSIPTLILVFTATLALAGCGHSGSISTRVGGTGTVNVFLTDAPIDLTDVQSVNVTLAGVIIYPAETSDPTEASTETSPISLLTHPATFDLLTLTGGATALLASGEVPAGNYGRIRLEISDATLVYKDATTVPLKIDSNKVDVPIRFRVTVGADNSVALDFDAAASVQVNETASGTFILRPVVTPVP